MTTCRSACQEQKDVKMLSDSQVSRLHMYTATDTNCLADRWGAEEQRQVFSTVAFRVKTQDRRNNNISQSTVALQEKTFRQIQHFRKHNNILKK